MGEVEGAVVTWPMAAPGEEVAEPCPCMRQSGKMIRRRCGPRGRWGQVDTTQCTVKMSYVVRRLCGVVSCMHAVLGDVWFDVICIAIECVY